MTTKHGRVVGPLTYREGDGVEMTIPTGPCEIEVTDLDVTLTWVDGENRGATAVPRDEFARYIKSGLLVIE